MSDMDITLDDLLQKYREHPYEDHKVFAPHTGVVTFKVEEGQKVDGPSGKWLHKPGTVLYILERQKNPKRITSKFNGKVIGLRRDLDGQFVQAGQELMVIRHRLGKEEIIDRILRQVLHVFPAPQRARYYFTPEISSIIEKGKAKALNVKSGDEIVIMSLMKRDSLIPYEGPAGVLYKSYFKNGDLLEQDAPLFGICSPDRLSLVEKVVNRIKTEWDD